MFEYFIEIEKRCGGPIKDALDRMEKFLIEELKSRNIAEYSKKMEVGILLYFKIEFYETFMEDGVWHLPKSKFIISLFDGIVMGDLTISYEDIMIDDTLKGGLKNFLDAYFEECSGLSGSMLGPRYDYYKYRLKKLDNSKDYEHCKKCKYDGQQQIVDHYFKDGNPCLYCKWNPTHEDRFELKEEF